ncbi:MAG: conjugal transfer protein TraX [Lachnospiraceae bacterium]|nr:conjugal transfer protein TraX [Lachnospiraceae bacterium]
MNDSKEITSFNLKLIAIITMFIDHIGAAIVEQLEVYPEFEDNTFLFMIDTPLRAIGRLAFPLFVFMIIEGFKYTSSKAKYLGRLAIFALISEIPFDFAIHFYEVDGGFPFSLTRQNVYFTLAFGLLGIIIIDKISTNYPAKAIEGSKAAHMNPNLRAVIRAIGIAGTTIVVLLMAKYSACDYDVAGVLAIIAGYLFRNNYISQITAIVLVLTIDNHFEAFAFIDLAFVAFYKGNKGKEVNKWIFYIFYPAHLLLLALIRTLIINFAA